MRRTSAVAVAAVLVVSGLGGAAAWIWLAKESMSPSTPTPRAEPPRVATSTMPGDAPHAFAPGEPPRLLPARSPDPARPPLSWERLLAADGSPAEDLASLRDMAENYLHSGLSGRGIAFNEDLIPALTNRDALGEAALPPDHPAIREGRLIDRWGTPWQVHPLAGDLIQLRSAGPDRRLYTSDDLVEPADSGIEP